MVKGFVVRLVAGLAVVTALALPAAAQAASKLESSGKFVGANRHITKGGVSIVKTDAGTLVILEGDFSLDGAPDPKVGFGKNGKYDGKSKVAHLAKNKGLQVYRVPASVDTSRYNEIYIWCEKFSVSLGVAKLK